MDILKDISFPRQNLNQASFRTALVKLIVVERLSFQFIESEVFQELLELINPAVATIMVRADTITSDTMMLYYGTREKIKKYFSDYDGKVNLTLDIWRSPNSKSILGITCHWARDLRLREIILDAIELKGKHTGKNIAKYVLKTLKELGIEKNCFV